MSGTTGTWFRFLAILLVTTVMASLAWAKPAVVSEAVEYVVSQRLAHNGITSQELSGTAAGAEVWLVVGSDSRHVTLLDSEPEHVTGRRADTIALWIVPARGESVVLHLPRDIRVWIPGHGKQKLGATYDYGLDVTLKAVQDLIDIPVHHVTEIDFDGLIGVVESLHGVTLTVPRSMRDSGSGLQLDAGVQTLDGTAVLALVRARHVEQLIDGRWIREEDGDLARIERQHAVIAALLQSAQRSDPVRATMGALRTVRSHVRFDETVTAADLVARAQRLVSGKEPQFMTIPVRPSQPPEEMFSPFPPAHVGGIVDLSLEQPAATKLLNQLRAMVPAPAD